MDPTDLSFVQTVVEPSSFQWGEPLSRLGVLTSWETERVHVGKLKEADNQENWKYLNSQTSFKTLTNPLLMDLTSMYWCLMFTGPTNEVAAAVDD